MKAIKLVRRLKSNDGSQKAVLSLIRIACITFSCCFLFMTGGGYAQNVGINTTGATPNAKALLDIDADAPTKAGLLVPRMTTAQRSTITAPIPESLLIYNTTTQCFEAWNQATLTWVAFGCIGCAAPTSVTASATPNPICAGGTLTLTGGATNATSWNWTGPNGFSSTLQSPTIPAITTAAAGVYTLTASNTCAVATSISTSSVNVNSLPTNVIVSGGGTFCGTATLTANGGTGGTIYWQGTTPGGTSTSTPSASQNVSSSGTYYFRAYNSCGWGAEGSASVTITTTPAQPGAISGPVLVTAASTGNSYSISPVSGATSYTWTVPCGATITSGQGTASITVTYPAAPPPSLTYTTPGTFNLDCIKDATITVIGGGGGGSNNGGGAGGGGGYSVGTFSNITSPLTIIVGGGGTSGWGGTAGGTTSVSSLISATGGGGGVYSSTPTGGAGGIGSGGTTNRTGGKGGNGRFTYFGGGGGGAAGSTGNGTNGANGPAYPPCPAVGGTGGAGGGAPAGAGGNGAGFSAGGCSSAYAIASNPGNNYGGGGGSGNGSPNGSCPSGIGCASNGAGGYCSLTAITYGGNVTVTANNSCGSSIVSSLFVTLNP